jgi:hypothetical protein
MSGEIEAAEIPPDDNYPHDGDVLVAAMMGGNGNMAGVMSEDDTGGLAEDDSSVACSAPAPTRGSLASERPGGMSLRIAIGPPPPQAARLQPAAQQLAW